MKICKYCDLIDSITGGFVYRCEYVNTVCIGYNICENYVAEGDVE